MNLKTQDNVFAVGGEGQPTQDKMESFALKLSQHLGKEISGAYFGSEKTRILPSQIIEVVSITNLMQMAAYF